MSSLSLWERREPIKIFHENKDASRGSQSNPCESWRLSAWPWKPSRWQLAEIGFRFSRHSQFFTGLVHVGSLLQKRTQHPTDGWSAGMMLEMNLIESQTCLPFFFGAPGHPKGPKSPPKGGDCLAPAGKLERKVGARMFQHFATFCIANKNHHHLKKDSMAFNGICTMGYKSSISTGHFHSYVK